MSEIYTIMSDVNTCHIPEHPHTHTQLCDEMVISCYFSIYEKPEDTVDVLDENDDPLGKKLGYIRGMLVLGQEIAEYTDDPGVYSSGDGNHSSSSWLLRYFQAQNENDGKS